ncbi:MAG TPA: DUF72 domain-containing protein [Candidatus Krumholzibacteriaceae bacterium]|nr:DUF72 domain-containing protein [Candidatus Krumholzibacteriaceae bacterium]
MMGKILLGCSGWHYKDWVGPLYTTETESKLATYSKVFKTAEIDSTFYAYPSKGVVMGWTKYTKPDFVFTAKLPKQITHKDKLDPKLGAEKDLERFCELMQPLLLEGKLGCLLAQLPPGLKCDLKLLESFFSVLPSQFRFAVEFRDMSWLTPETWRLLERYKVAYTIVDEPKLPPEVEVTSDIAYIRWHGRGERPWYYYLYSKEELEPWVPKVKEAATKAKTTYGYFNNHYHGYAVKNCIEFAEMLGTITPEQKETKKTVENYFQERETAKQEEMKKRAVALTAFMPTEIQKMSFSQLLNIFMDKGRLKRAEGIKDNEVAMQEASSSRVIAAVREYHIIFDMQNRTILHDCADWSRCIPAKQFCKHVGKVLLMLPREKATGILRQIASEREKWEFKPYVSQA